MTPHELRFPPQKWKRWKVLQFYWTHDHDPNKNFDGAILMLGVFGPWLILASILVWTILR